MTARYQIELTRTARRALDSLPTKVQKQIDRHIRALAKNPYLLAGLRRAGFKGGSL